MRKKILVVDDDQAIGDVVQLILRHLPDNEIIGISVPLFEQRQPDRFFRLFFMGVSGPLGQTFEREAKERRQNNR